MNTRLKITESHLSPLPDSVREGVLHKVRKFTRFIPPWVDEVMVDFDYQDKGSTASCTSSRPYRYVRITTHNLYLSSTEEARDATIAHELAHSWFQPVVGAMSSGLETLGVDKTQGELLWNSVDREHEEMTECLAQLFLEMGNIEVRDASPHSTNNSEG